jgi:hypothetical protein
VSAQDGQRHTLRAVGRSSKVGRGALQVVAFRENKDYKFRQDFKDQTSIGTDFKRGAKQAQVSRRLWLWLNVALDSCLHPAFVHSLCACICAFTHQGTAFLKTVLQCFVYRTYCACALLALCKYYL